ncbi:MAG TPA: DUF4440 domain-containing protein [Vicinamibacterales bacterium]
MSHNDADAIREAYRILFALGPTIEMRTIKVVRAGNLAMLQSRWTWRASSADGEPIQREGQSMETVRLQQDGRWLFVIDDPGAFRTTSTER